MSQLVAHIKSLNAKTQAWVDEDPANRWAGMLVEDEAHWAEQGVHTVEDFERRELEIAIYEGHKDAYGVKGRHYDFDSMSMDELRAEADRISQAAREAFEREEEAAREAVEAFEAEVAQTISYGAGDRATALRWMTQDEEFYHSQDVEHWVWNKGMLFTAEGKALVKELMTIVSFKEWDAA
jgi:hypothetical protein